MKMHAGQVHVKQVYFPVAGEQLAVLVIDKGGVVEQPVLRFGDGTADKNHAVVPRETGKLATDVRVAAFCGCMEILPAVGAREHFGQHNNRSAGDGSFMNHSRGFFQSRVIIGLGPQLADSEWKTAVAHTSAFQSPWRLQYS